MRRYWIWYDNLDEPYRLGMAMLMMSPIFISSAIMEYFPLLFIGSVLFVFSLLIHRHHARKP
jgi:hypothetical protein